MPKVKLGASAYEQADAIIRGEFAREKARRSCNVEGFAKLLHLKRATYFNKVRDPGSLTLRELRQFLQVAQTDPETLVKMIGGDKYD